MSRRRIKVIHTSDVHLESDTFGRSEEGQKYRRRIQGAFQKVVDQVIAEDADLFLIAGALDLCGLGLGTTECRQQHARENGDDGNDH